MKPLLLALLLACPGAARADLLVFAAASLGGALDRAVAQWQAQGGDPVTVSYAGSSALARQIVAGAPADLFISASADWMDAVEAEALLQQGSRRDLLGNRLVLVSEDPDAAPVTIDAALDLSALLGAGRLAMALVEAVPAGQYGKAALQSLGLWDAVAPQVAQAENVRAALALVASGAAPLGVVYATDAREDPRVTVIGSFPEDSHDPIRYPAALIAGADPAAAEFLEFLGSDPAGAIFAASGFEVIE